MKKGQRIGMNRRKAGVSGEKYIVFEKAIQRYRVFITTGKVGRGKQKIVAKFRELKDAVSCRDKYLSEIKHDS